MYNHAIFGLQPIFGQNEHYFSLNEVHRNSNNVKLEGRIVRSCMKIFFVHFIEFQGFWPLIKAKMTVKNIRVLCFKKAIERYGHLMFFFQNLTTTLCEGYGKLIHFKTNTDFL